MFTSATKMTEDKKLSDTGALNVEGIVPARQKDSVDVGVIIQTSKALKKIEYYGRKKSILYDFQE
jgi:hypothetical protein